MTDADDMIATGTATQTQLSKLFRVDKNRVPEMLTRAGIAPVGKRKTYPIYNVRDAAAAFVKVGFEIEEAIRGMNQADIPPLVAKEFWNGQISREKYEQMRGNRWETDDVQAMVAALLQVVSINQKLMLDNVERQSGLTTEQRAIIKRISEGTVNATREAIAERFAEWAAPQDNPSGAVDLGDVL